jgi:hypothetical protein
MERSNRDAIARLGDVSTEVLEQLDLAAWGAWPTLLPGD